MGGKNPKTKFVLLRTKINTRVWLMRRKISKNNRIHLHKHTFPNLYFHKPYTYTHIKCIDTHIVAVRAFGYVKQTEVPTIVYQI